MWKLHATAAICSFINVLFAAWTGQYAFGVTALAACLYASAAAVAGRLKKKP